MWCAGPVCCLWQQELDCRRRFYLLALPSSVPRWPKFSLWPLKQEVLYYCHIVKRHHRWNFRVQWMHFSKLWERAALQQVDLEQKSRRRVLQWVFSLYLSRPLSSSWCSHFDTMHLKTNLHLERTFPDFYNQRSGVTSKFKHGPCWGEGWPLLVK